MILSVGKMNVAEKDKLKYILSPILATFILLILAINHILGTPYILYVK